MLSLNEQSGYNKTLLYYEKNKEKPLTEWLELEKIFPHLGKHGLVGILKGKDDEKIKYVFKISQNINYLAFNEFAVMNSLISLSDYCPHFCRSIGTLICDVDSEKRKEGNPFVIESKYKIEKEILLCEYIENSYKFCNYIFSDKIIEDSLYSTVKQVLLTLSIAQREKNFTHYDLHSNNIMMKKCSKDLVFLYVLDNENQFCVPTYGSYPILIDFGFSFSKDLNGDYFWSSLNYTDVGFLSDRFDPFADPKLFLVTVSSEIHSSKRSRKSKKLKNIVRNNYSYLPIDWDSGWDNDKEKCASEYVLNRLEKYTKHSKLFKEYEFYCFDILQSLIILPLEKQNTDNLDVSFLTFLTEFIKIENEISNPFFCLYILKNIVDAARLVKIDYLNLEKRPIAVSYFKNTIIEKINSISKFCQLKNLHYEKMLCGLLCSIKCIEGVLYLVLNREVQKKDKIYKKIPLQTPEEIVSVIDINLGDDYTFNHKTTLLVIDNIKKCCYPFNMTENQKNQINSTHALSRGMEIYNFIKKENISLK